MASFLVRAFDLAEAPSAKFTDTRGSTHETSIDRLFAAGITVGCTQDPLRYCPNNPVSRAQMATLLNRGLDNEGIETGSISINVKPRSGDTLIAATRGRTCAIRLDSTVTCWGGEEGRLEHLSASGLEDVVALSTGNHPTLRLHTCVVHDDGTVSCWGSGHEGQLGRGDRTHHLPEVVPGISDAVAVASGPSFTCVVHDGGEVSCWGLNLSGQLGDSAPVSNRYWPRRVPGVEDVVAISVGEDRSCAIHDDGDLSCWGRGYGDTPSTVRAPKAVTSVSIGGIQTCVSTVDGLVHCWESGTGAASRMIRAGNISDAVKVSVGDGSACVLHRRGGVSCWGRNDVGQVGDGTTIDRQQPVRLGRISDAVDMSVSSGSPTVGAHACALHEDRSVSCWGGNELGQLGDGTLDNGLTPRRVNRLQRIPADRRPITPADLLLDWVDIVVQNRGADFGWLRVAWDHVREQTSVNESGFGGDVSTRCYANAFQLLGCEVLGMVVTDMSLETAIHELARVYDLHTGLAPRQAWGAVQLYFATTHPDCFAGSDRHGAEILANTALHVMVPHAYLTHYERRLCPGLPRSPTAEAEQVVLEGLAGQVPDWYDENITNGAELWTAWLRGPSLVALANLSWEFGGLCNTDWITYPLDPERFPPADSNPFRDGGC